MNDLYQEHEHHTQEEWVKLRSECSECFKKVCACGLFIKRGKDGVCNICKVVYEPKERTSLKQLPYESWEYRL